VLTSSPDATSSDIKENDKAEAAISSDAHAEEVEAVKATVDAKQVNTDDQEAAKVVASYY